MRAIGLTGAGVLLALMAILAGGAALRESVTIDEVAHIGAGVSYWQKLDLRLNEEHPPLPKLIAALPLVVRGIHVDYSQPPWQVSGALFNSMFGEWAFGDWVVLRWNDPATTVALARAPMLLFTLLLGWTIFVYARRLGGDWAGLLCIAAFVTTPMFLATAPLVITDTAVVLFCLLALWRMAELWRDPSKLNVRWFALALAGALLSKFTAILLFFAFLSFILSTRWWPVADQPQTKEDARVWRRLRWRATLRGIGLAALITYAVYFVFSWNQPNDVLSALGSSAVMSPIKRLLMPPWLYLRGVGVVLIQGSRVTFVLGHSYPHGVWFYFPVVFILKSTVGFLGLLALTAIVAPFARRMRPRTPLIPATLTAHWRMLWVALLVIGGVSLLSRLDIGLRHFGLPIVLLILLIAPLPAVLTRFTPAVSRSIAAVAVLCTAASIFVAVRTFPYYVPYANALRSGRPAYQLFNDSNVDWNQSLPDVKRFADQQGMREIPIDVYGFADMQPYVPGARFWDCQHPAQTDAGRWVIISANMILDGHNCPWVVEQPHKVLAGGSMYAVRLPASIPPAGASGGPPLPADYHTFGGFPMDQDPRQLFKDVIDAPDTIPQRLADMMAKYQKQRPQ